MSPLLTDDGAAWPYNTRIQKGGALIGEMRELVRFWSDEPTEILVEQAIRLNVLNKATRTRAADILRRTYLPRFLAGSIPDAWRLVRPLEDASGSIQMVRPLYYWLSARAEPLIADFVIELLQPHQSPVGAGIGTEDVLRWLWTKNCPWSPTVATKVARGMLAALRDFGVLEGLSRKRLASIVLTVPAFAYLALCMRRTGVTNSSLLIHRDWQLFLLSPGDVERLFMLAHQEGLLDFHAAGSTVSLNFPTDSLEEYAHVVTR